MQNPERSIIVCASPSRSNGTHGSLVPRPSRAPARKRVWYIRSNFLVVLIQHVYRNYISLHDCHVFASQSSARALGSNAIWSHYIFKPSSNLIELLNFSNMLTQHNQEIRPFFTSSLIPSRSTHRGKEHLVWELLIQNLVRCIRTARLVCYAYGAPPTKVYGLRMHVTLIGSSAISFEISFSRTRTKKCVNRYQTPFSHDEWVGSGFETKRW